MRTYGQYCPVARASEILGERWTPIILRNLLNGARTYSAIASDAPGISRTLLSSRLRQLHRTGLLSITPNPAGRGSCYAPTDAGLAMGAVLESMGRWADRWLELGPEHVDPGMLLTTWQRHSLADDLLPRRRVVVRFDFPDQPAKVAQLWFIFDRRRSEVCRTWPGFEEDAVVTADATTLTEWHLGRVEWADAIRSGRIEVSGPPALVRKIPSWNRRDVRYRPTEPARPSRHAAIPGARRPAATRRTRGGG